MDLNLESNVYVSKISFKEENIYIKLTWKENESDLFVIQIFEGKTTWSGRFSLEFAEKYRKCIDENKEEYNKNVKNALSEESANYKYVFTKTTDDNDSATFTWKKKFADAVKVHGSVPLRRDNNPESKDVLIDYLLTENKKFNDIITNLNAKNERICADLEKCKCEMREFVNIKSSLEASLYGKFIKLLNSKKRRIQLLEENLTKIDKQDSVQRNCELD